MSFRLPKLLENYVPLMCIPSGHAPVPIHIQHAYASKILFCVPLSHLCFLVYAVVGWISWNVAYAPPKLLTFVKPFCCKIRHA